MCTLPRRREQTPPAANPLLAGLKALGPPGCHVTAVKAQGVRQGEGRPPRSCNPSHGCGAPLRAGTQPRSHRYWPSQGNPPRRRRARRKRGEQGSCHSARAVRQRPAPSGDPIRLCPRHTLYWVASPRPCSLFAGPPVCLRVGDLPWGPEAQLYTWGTWDPPTRQKVLLARAPTWEKTGQTFLGLVRHCEASLARTWAAGSATPRNSSPLGSAPPGLLPGAQQPFRLLQSTGPSPGPSLGLSPGPSMATLDLLLPFWSM